MSPSRDPYIYKHDEWVGGFGDVLKHVTLHAVVQSLQEQHTDGVMVVDCMAGDGVYDLNNHDNAKAYQTGICKVLDAYKNNPSSTPAPVAAYLQTLLAVTGCDGSSSTLDVYPGSPVVVQSILRPGGQDEHRLIDNTVDEIQWVENDSTEIRLGTNAYNAIEFILPYTHGGKHPIIYIDPDYSSSGDGKEGGGDHGKVQSLMKTILDQHPFATIVVYAPLLQNDPFRWSYSKSLRELAKKFGKMGRYYGNIVVDKDNFQGAAILVVNPTREFDDILSDETLHWLAHTMNRGKDEYTVEQTNKKLKKSSN